MKVEEEVAGERASGTVARRGVVSRPEASFSWTILTGVCLVGKVGSGLSSLASSACEAMSECRECLGSEEKAKGMWRSLKWCHQDSGQPCGGRDLDKESVRSCRVMTPQTVARWGGKVAEDLSPNLLW